MKRRIILAALVVLALAAAGTAYGVSRTAAATQTITACVNDDGQLRLAPDKGCKKNEQLLTWNTVGPVGPAGLAGAAGLQGVAGPQGPAGRDGRDAAGGSSNPDAVAATISATGQKAGVIADHLDILSVSHEVTSPRDVASGLPTGKRVHKPFTITMAWGTSSPLFIGALADNENLTKVEVDFTGGVFKLTNASVSDYQLHGSTVTLSFTYQKIEWDAGTIVAEDDWEAPVS